MNTKIASIRKRIRNLVKFAAETNNVATVETTFPEYKDDGERSDPDKGTHYSPLTIGAVASPTVGYDAVSLYTLQRNRAAAARAAERIIQQREREAEIRRNTRAQEIRDAGEHAGTAFDERRTRYPYLDIEGYDPTREYGPRRGLTDRSEDYYAQVEARRRNPTAPRPDRRLLTVTAGDAQHAADRLAEPGISVAERTRCMAIINQFYRQRGTPEFGTRGGIRFSAADSDLDDAITRWVFGSNFDEARYLRERGVPYAGYAIPTDDDMLTEYGLQDRAYRTLTGENGTRGQTFFNDHGRVTQADPQRVRTQAVDTAQEAVRHRHRQQDARHPDVTIRQETQQRQPRFGEGAGRTALNVIMQLPAVIAGLMAAQNYKPGSVTESEVPDYAADEDE